MILNRLEEEVVNLENDAEVARQDLTDHVDRPGLERFGHQRMVGIREDLAADVKSAVPAEFMFVNQQTHQFGDRQHRMGIIQVNGDLVRQVVPGLVHPPVAIQDVLHGRGDQEIFLAQTQFTA